jgi:hypothetical protein
MPHTLQVTLLVCRTDFRMRKTEKQRERVLANGKLLEVHRYHRVGSTW